MPEITPETNESKPECTFCGDNHPVDLSVAGNVTYGQPGREGVLTFPHHTPCSTCGTYHAKGVNHNPCRECGEVHSDIRPWAYGRGFDSNIRLENPQHGPNRYCEGCNDYVDQEHADNWEERHYGSEVRDSEAQDEGWHSRYPRNEHELVNEEPERVAGINERIGKIVKMHDARVADSPYFIKHAPSGTYYGQHGNNVQVYHRNAPNTRVGSLTYDDEGKVGSMYIDHRHQGTMAAIQMLVAAHRHLKDTVGNPIGLLRTENTTNQSAGLIKNIDPNSTYLRHDNADEGKNENWVDGQSEISNTPLRNDSLRLTKEDWHIKSEESGRSVADLLAMSYDPKNRYVAYDAGRPSDEAKAIGEKIKKHQDEDSQDEEKQYKRIVGTAAANIIAQGVHEVPGDMPPHDWLENAWQPSARDRIAALRTPQVLQSTQPMDVAANLSHESLSYLRGRAREATPQDESNRKTTRYLYSSSKPDPDDIRAVVEARHGLEAPDLIGTSGVWTGDEETDEKATLPAPKPTLPLDLNPYERVKRITDPMGRRSYVQGD